MDDTEKYYDWIHYIEDKLVTELEKDFGNKFVRAKELIEGAEKHSEAMLKQGKPYGAPEEFWKPAVCEIVCKGVVCYQRWEEKDRAIEKKVEEIAESFWNSRHHRFLRYFFAQIGVGIAIEETPGQVALYATVRLTPPPKNQVPA